MEDNELLISAKPSKRILAFILDIFLNLAVSLVLLVPSIIALINIFLNKSEANIIALFISSIFSGALLISFAVFYFVCLPVIFEGQTLGKRFANIRVVDVHTNQGPNAKIMFIREGSRIIIFVLSFGLSIIPSLITLCISKKSTTFHEQISSTRVVNVNVYPENKIKNSDPDIIL